MKDTLAAGLVGDATRTVTGVVLGQARQARARRQRTKEPGVRLLAGGCQQHRAHRRAEGGA